MRITCDNALEKCWNWDIPGYPCQWDQRRGNPTYPYLSRVIQTQTVEGYPGISHYKNNILAYPKTTFLSRVIPGYPGIGHRSGYPGSRDRPREQLSFKALLFTSETLVHPNSFVNSWNIWIHIWKNQMKSFLIWIHIWIYICEFIYIWIHIIIIWIHINDYMNSYTREFICEMNI